MTKYYVLTATTSRSLRQLLKNSLGAPRSSCYQLADEFFVLVESSLPLADECLMAAPAADTARGLLLWWAYAEITQSNDFICLEDSALAELNGCSQIIGGQKVFRSYHGLSELMLIINQTPDSFSEKGLYSALSPALKDRIKQALAAGISLIDIGGVSTAPQAPAVSSLEEIRRLTPVINFLTDLKSTYTFKISLDSYSAETIRHFLARIDIVNDVSASLADECLLELIASNKAYIFMHSLTIPANPQVQLSKTSDPLAQLLSWGQQKITHLTSLGFQPEKLIFDVGIGFNKTTAQSWYLLRHIASFQQLGVELLVGHSRKRFIGKVSTNPFAQRDWESGLIADYLQTQLVDYLRVHEYSQLQLISKVANQLGRI